MEPCSAIDGHRTPQTACKEIVSGFQRSFRPADVETPKLNTKGHCLCLTVRKVHMLFVTLMWGVAPKRSFFHPRNRRNYDSPKLEKPSSSVRVIITRLALLLYFGCIFAIRGVARGMTANFVSPRLGLRSLTSLIIFRSLMQVLSSLAQGVHLSGMEQGYEDG